MNVGDLVAYKGGCRFIGVVKATKKFPTSGLVRHLIEWQTQGLVRGVWYNAKDLEILNETR
jgi:hypothetical protein|tara:strand:- start:408 stop:590 length:183 start_codon:yes stop_codon:yes gene_type:complete